jgi:hypothetical protein
VELEGLEYYPAGKSLMKAETDCGYKPDYTLNIGGLNDITKKTFTNGFNLLYIPADGPVTSKVTFMEIEIDYMVKNYFKLRSIVTQDDIDAFKGDNNLPEQEGLVENAIKFYSRVGRGYSGTSEVKKNGYGRNSQAKGLIGVVDLYVQFVEAIERDQLANDFLLIKSNSANFFDARELVEYGVRHSEIIDKKWIKENEQNTIPKSANMQLKTDLINFIMDGSTPNSNNSEYVEMIKKSGMTLYNNRENILKEINSNE